jgi:hypothetical protein
MFIKQIEAWKNVLLKPKKSVFVSYFPKKSNIMTFVSIVVAALLGLGLSWLIFLITGQNPDEFRGLVSAWVDNQVQPPFLNWSILIFLGTIVGFYDFQIVLFIFAWLLKGRGSFGTQSYLQSLFYAPLVIIQQAVIVVPIVGLILFGIVAIYSLVPTTNSLKAAHSFSTAKAILTWLLPIILNVIIIFIITAVLISRSK